MSFAYPQDINRLRSIEHRLSENSQRLIEGLEEYISEPVPRIVVLNAAPQKELFQINEAIGEGCIKAKIDTRNLDTDNQTEMVSKLHQLLLCDAVVAFTTALRIAPAILVELLSQIKGLQKKTLVVVGEFQTMPSQNGAIERKLLEAQKSLALPTGEYLACAKDGFDGAANYVQCLQTAGDWVNRIDKVNRAEQVERVGDYVLNQINYEVNKLEDAYLRTKRILIDERRIAVGTVSSLPIMVQTTTSEFANIQDSVHEILGKINWAIVKEELNKNIEDSVDNSESQNEMGENEYAKSLESAIWAVTTRSILEIRRLSSNGLEFNVDDIIRQAMDSLMKNQNALQKIENIDDQLLKQINEYIVDDTDFKTARKKIIEVIPTIAKATEDTASKFYASNQLQLKVLNVLWNARTMSPDKFGPQLLGKLGKSSSNSVRQAGSRLLLLADPLVEQGMESLVTEMVVELNEASDLKVESLRIELQSLLKNAFDQYSSRYVSGYTRIANKFDESHSDILKYIRQNGEK